MAIYGNIENLDAVILGDITAEPIHIDGEDGRGVVSARINAQQHLIITYTDGTTEDAGAVGEGAGVVIDPTLSIEGAAAEAKATGEAIGAVADDVTDIVNLIPLQATPQNQLADKAFVNSTVGTNTAIFRGTFNSLAELQAYTGEKTNNDYAFVIATDVNGNTVYNRYKFNGSSWVFEYALNNSSFTAAQWAAISSGITAALVASYNAHIADSDIHVTAADKIAWNGKLADAPSDGKQYARKNGAWAEVQGGGGAFTVIEQMTEDEVSLLPDGAYVSRDNEGTWDYWLKGTALNVVTIYEFECMDETTSSFYIYVGTAGNVEEKVMIDASGELSIGDMLLYASGEDLKFNNKAIALKSDLNDYRTAAAQDVIDSGFVKLIGTAGQTIQTNVAVPLNVKNNIALQHRAFVGFQTHDDNAIGFIGVDSGKPTFLAADGVTAKALQGETIADTAGYFTTDTVEGALAEIGAELSGINTLVGSGVIT